jgi:cbb3-type cytochrome oxidase cytochrome c subunit
MHTSVALAVLSLTVVCFGFAIQIQAYAKAKEALEIAREALSAANAKLASKHVIVASGAQVCSRCHSHVHRYEIQEDGSVLCANCITENV